MSKAATVEEWKQVDGYDYYDVSNFGRVRSKYTGRMLVPRLNHAGYARVQLSKDKVKKDFFIHRLVAAAFCVHPEGCNVINHLDYNPKNNRADNLEWTTQKENNYYTMDGGRNPKYPSPKPVVGIKDGIEKQYRSANEAARMTGCNAQGISECCNGKRNQHHGYVWKFTEVAI